YADGLVVDAAVSAAKLSHVTCGFLVDVRSSILLMRKILVRRFLPVLAALPVTSLIICVVWTVAEDPSGLTRTHCAIPNYVPSLSASVSSGLRKRIWIASIGLSCAARIFVHSTYNFSLSHLADVPIRMGFLLQAHYWLHLIEILCLFLLTIFTSKENFPIHRNAFSLFVISCSLFGFLDLHILRGLQNTYPSLTHSIRRKSHFYALMTVSILLSALCYLLHNRYCISHVYSIFALFEHIFILSNLAFHYYVIDVIGDLPLMFFDPIARTLSLDARSFLEGDPGVRGKTGREAPTNSGFGLRYQIITAEIV
ncbi:Post-GPI attachment to protein factor 2, partial [Taenia solium]